MNITVDLTGVRIQTERLVLRPFKEEDLEDFYEYAKVPGVGERAGWIHHSSREESRGILEMFIREKRTFAIECRGKVIGSLGVDNYDEEEFPEFAGEKAAEIGYVLSGEYWGQGLMSEAVKAVIRYLWDHTDLEVLLCSHYNWNTQSCRVQEKCGFIPHRNYTGKTRYGTEEPSEMRILRRPF